MRGAARKSKKRKRGGKILNLISFKLGVLGGKLTLISYLFLNFLDSFKAQIGALLPLARSRSLCVDLPFGATFALSFWINLCYFSRTTRLCNHLGPTFMF
jgi:hypothetical protein